MKGVKTYFGLVVIQIAFITVVILGITAVRIFDAQGFEELREIYGRYALFDTDTSLVYGEEP